MNSYRTTGIRFKIFVNEKNPELACEKSITKVKSLPITSLTGDEAKEYYEDILKESSLSLKKKKPLIKPKHQIIIKPTAKPSERKIFKNTDLLWMAQNNDVKNLNIFFTQNKVYDVNIVDDFGWTPLMCASCSGAEEAVTILIEKGADLYKCDKLGNTALKLARQKNRQNIVKILQNNKNKPEIIGDEIRREESAENFFCPNCKENFSTNKNKHESSTLHLFNSVLKTSPTFYGIPESNKGFQLLLQEGWDKEKGLGPNGTGRKFPVKVVMKKDRTGIGAPPLLKNKREIEHSEKYESRKRKIYKRWKNKDFERNFRLEFS